MQLQRWPWSAVRRVHRILDRSISEHASIDRLRPGVPFFELTRATLLAFVLLTVGVAPLLGRQPPASQHGTVSQRINTTTVTIEYDRPSARGRTLFGEDGIVVSDALWTPGANRATTIEFSAAVSFAGKPVPAGRYSVWTIPRDRDWTLILNRVWDTHHAIYPGEQDDVLRTGITPGKGAHMEALTWYFPVVGPYDATIRMHWGELYLAIPIEVGNGTDDTH
jgi:Protein of unknown function (DUF2911)